MHKLRFLHIPKTAGTTFTGILLRQYLCRKSFEFSGDLTRDVTRYRSMPSEEKGRLQLFFGHAPIFTGDAEIDGLPIITFLREPVSRVISFCQHVAEGKSPYLRDTFRPTEFDLDRFLISGNYELSNLQTKMLLDDHMAAELATGVLPETTASELALNALFNRVSAFGLQEYFDESLMIFCARFNWWPPLYSLNYRSISTRTLIFEQHHLEKIQELNGADIKLYATAKKKFLEQVGYLSSSKTKLRRFQAVNSLMGNMMVHTFERFLSLLSAASNR